MDRAELGALRDAIDTTSNWPDWCATKSRYGCKRTSQNPTAPIPAPSRSRWNRPPGFKPSVQELAGREQVLLEAMRGDPEAGVVQWAKTTRCDKSAVSMRLGRLAKRGLVERDGNGRWRLAGETLRRRRLSDGGGGGRASGAHRCRMPAMANSDRGVNFTRCAVAGSAGSVPGNEGDDLGCSLWVSNR